MRALSDIESFYVEIDISIVTSSHIQGSVSIEILRKALHLVVMRHPLLTARIIKKSKSLYFENIPEFEVPFKIYENTKIHAIEQEVLNVPLDIESGLIRVNLLLSPNKAVLITKFHHAIGDGLSSIELHKEILQTYADLAENKTSKAPALALMPSIEDLLSGSVSSSEISDYARKYAEFADSISPQVLPPEKEESAQTIDFVQMKLNRNELHSLLKQCKAQHTTVHGAICAAHLLAIRELLNKNQQPIDLCCHSAMDIRSRMDSPITKEHMISGAWGWAGCYSVDLNTSLWSLAKQMSDDLKKIIANKDLFKRTLSFSNLKKQIPIALYVTNIGNIEIPKRYNHLTLKEIYFIPAYRKSIFVAAIGTFNNQLYIHYPYLKPYYSSKLISKIANRAKALLLP